jgi:signal transduction histidine kinase
LDQSTILDRRLTRQAVVGLELPHQVLQEVLAEGAERTAEYQVAWEDPRKVHLLPDLLAVARENRRLQGGRLFAKLEEDNNRLNEVLAHQVQSEEDRLRHTCLAALAELAAGAGHEINNPLAVISGQAQYLLGHEHDWFVETGQDQVRDSLQAVIAQTRRIHGLLRDLMLFARPPSPRWEWVDLARLIGEVAASFRDASEGQGIQLEVDCSLERLLVKGDADMLRQALLCLVRNAVEAVASPGWVRLVLGMPQPGQPVEVRVEDSGPGPSAEQQKHLFDPFYSGRNSGRGKGMGLPIAWRLAQCHGGDVRLEMSPSQPTTFVLSLAANGPVASVPAPSGNVIQAVGDRRLIVNAAG